MSDNLEVSLPVEDKDQKPEEEKKAAEAATDSPSISEAIVPEKYKGKSLEEVIKMHENAEKLASKLGSEKHELTEKLNAKEKEQEVDLMSLFTSEPTPEATPQEQPEIDEVKQLRTEQAKSNIALSIMFARQDDSMPEWSKYEKEALAMAQSDGAILMLSKNWTKKAYDLVLAGHLNEKIAEAEERGKNIVKEETRKDIEATVIDASSNAPAPVKPVVLTRTEKLALVRQGKLSMAEVIGDSLTEAEKK